MLNTIQECAALYTASESARRNAPALLLLFFSPLLQQRVYKYTLLLFTL